MGVINHFLIKCKTQSTKRNSNLAPLPGPKMSKWIDHRLKGKPLLFIKWI